MGHFQKLKAKLFIYHFFFFNMAETKNKKSIWKRWYMIVLYIFVGLIIIGSLLPDSNNSQTNTLNNINQLNGDIIYEVIEQWSIPNGGYGKKILISRSYLNEEDMIALGNKLKQDTANDRNAFIQVYTNRDAADLRDKVLADEGTQTENELYDEHFVGLYSKNANNGNHQFNIFFDGTSGINQKTINY